MGGAYDHRFLVISIAMSSKTTDRLTSTAAMHRARVRMDSLEVIESNLPRRQVRFVLAWAELRQDGLREDCVAPAA